MPEPSSQPATAPRQVASPRPLAPVDGQAADATSIAFSWSDEVEGPYVFQLAHDEAFEDVISTITAGDAQSLVLYDTLEIDQPTEIFWRVRGQKKNGWSEAARFTAVDADRLRAEREERDRLAREESRRALQAHLEGDERVPVALAEESELTHSQTAIILGVIVISFIVLLIILMIFGQVTYPAEAIT